MFPESQSSWRRARLDPPSPAEAPLTAHGCSGPEQGPVPSSASTSKRGGEWSHITATRPWGTTQPLELPGSPHNIQRRQLRGDAKACPHLGQLRPHPSSPTQSRGLPFPGVGQRRCRGGGQEECGQRLSNSSLRRDPRRLAEAQSAGPTPGVWRVGPKMCISNTFPRDLQRLGWGPHWEDC